MATYRPRRSKLKKMHRRYIKRAIDIPARKAAKQIADSIDDSIIKKWCRSMITHSA